MTETAHVENKAPERINVLSIDGGGIRGIIPATILTEIDCEASDGFYVGDGTDCDPNPCYPVPTIESSWGRVKETFRELLRRK